MLSSSQSLSAPSSSYKTPFLERVHIKSPPPPPAYRTPEEEKAEALRLKKIERAKVLKAKEKARLKREKEFTHANSSAGIYTQFYKNEDQSINWWRMCLF